jgi:biopolymer transport protein ExbB/TolQ
MEITSFVLGVLAIVTVAMVAVIVVGIVKILKLSNQVSDLNLRLDRSVDHIYREMQKQHESIWRQFEETGRDVTVVEKTIMNQIDQTNQELDLKIGQNKQEVEQKIFEHAAASSRYIDSRIDKLIDTYFEYNAISKKSKKEVING